MIATFEFGCNITLFIWRCWGQGSRGERIDARKRNGEKGVRLQDARKKTGAHYCNLHDSYEVQILMRLEIQRAMKHGCSMKQIMNLRWYARLEDIVRRGGCILSLQDLAGADNE